jgi:DNA anti-recombination protein RmuC
MNGESAPKPLVNGAHSADTPLQNDENRLQNASTSEDEQVDPLEETPSQIAKKRPNNQLKKVEELGDRSQGSGVSTNSSVLTPNHSLTEALEDLFEKSLAEAAAEELEMKGNHEQDT